jgi:ribosomal subunit interface protein
MKLSITFKNFEPSDHLHKYAQRRFDKLGRFLRKSEGIEATAVLSVDKYRHKTDVKLQGEGLTITAVEESPDMYTSLDLVYEKVAAQLKKHMAQRKEKRRAGAPGKAMDVFSFHTEGEPGDRIIVGVDKFEPKPLFDNEAAMQLEQREDEFLVFLNADSENVNVIFRRKNGEFGLIDLGSA